MRQEPYSAAVHDRRLTLQRSHWRARVAGARLAMPEQGKTVMTVKAYAFTAAIALAAAGAAQAQVTRLPAAARPVLPTAKAPPPALSPAAKTQMLQTLLKGPPPAVSGTYTLSTRNPLVQGQGALSFQNALNTFAGGLDAPDPQFPVGFTQFRNTDNGGTPFGFGRLRMDVKIGQGLVIDCKVNTDNDKVAYQLYSPDGGSSQTTVTLPSSGPTAGHLVIAAPKAGKAGVVDLMFRPASSGQDMTVYECDVSSY